MSVISCACGLNHAFVPAMGAPPAAAAAALHPCSTVRPPPPPPPPSFPLLRCRYEDNGDAVTNMVVLVQKVGKNSIDDLGSPDKFLSDNAYLFGESAAFTGELPG